MPLITLAQADAHLRLDLDLTGSPPADPRVPDLQLKMVQAEAIIIDYLKLDDDEYELAVNGDPNASPPTDPTWSDRDQAVVQAAVLLVLSALYDDEIQRTLGDYLADNGVIARLLMRLRDPALA
jgi:hypothetical protein